MKKEPACDLAKFIDFTFLGAAGDGSAIRELCRTARTHGFASVCVNPAEIELASRLLRGSSVKVCTVIGFPLGQATTSVKCVEARDAIARGAQELDFVVNQRLLRTAPDRCLDELKALVVACREAPVTLGLPAPLTKLILECCNLTKAEIVRGCRLARQAGFDFVKTSTGFGKSGATVEDVRLMRKTVGRELGVKAAGGIRTRDAAMAMIAAGATRIGASACIA